ncbi:hypothetical protein E0Z10_g3761 [Xylaria hypoxylon]|uniref:NmrA-like domain-containing protein n=1 Tax=Xylaria hypoxylon TaxID=37992 RepID=A0A4Z0Z2M9_9PEZI|nr:hypothetical protein E0Z10_g3761 [Xylaria hypoxylon]
MSPTIFVVAATGTIGKALALDLRKIGWGVHVTVRDPASPAATELASAGVKLFPGDWDDEKALKDGIAGCDGLFLNLMPSFTDWDADIRQGKNIVSIAKAAGVKHVIYSSGIKGLLKGINPNGLVSKFVSNKKIIEGAVRAAGFEAYTILRPAAFMANWLAPKVAMYRGLADTGTFHAVLKPDTVIFSVDEHDVAAFSIAAFKDPARFNGQDISVASETHTTEEVLKSLSQAIGRPIKGNYLSDEEALELAKTDPLTEGQLASRQISEHFNMEDVRKWGIPLHSFQEFLEREKASVQETYSRLL